MARYVPSFLGSTERSASQFSERQSLRNHLLEVRDDENLREDEIQDNALSSHCGESSPSRSHVSSPRITLTKWSHYLLVARIKLVRSDWYIFLGSLELILY